MFSLTLWHHKGAIGSRNSCCFTQLNQSRKTPGASLRGLPKVDQHPGTALSIDWLKNAEYVFVPQKCLFHIIFVYMTKPCWASFWQLLCSHCSQIDEEGRDWLPWKLQQLHSAWPFNSFFGFLLVLPKILQIFTKSFWHVSGFDDHGPVLLGAPSSNWRSQALKGSLRDRSEQDQDPWNRDQDRSPEPMLENTPARGQRSCPCGSFLAFADTFSVVRKEVPFASQMLFW